MPEFNHLQIAFEDGIAVVTIHRPQALNALNEALLGELDSAFAGLETDDAVRGVLLTGAGEKAFVAGADIGELSELDPQQAVGKARQGQALMQRIARCSKPVVAAVNGFALGGGCELAMACHLRIASETACFGQPEVKLGVIPGFGGSQRLPRLVGRAAALDLLLTGRMIDAAEAHRLGLVSRVVEPDRLLEEGRSLLGEILSRGPLAVRYLMEAVNAGSDMPLAEGLSLEATLFGLCFATEDMREGTRAFLEKRAAQFKGK